MGKRGTVGRRGRSGPPHVGRRGTVEAHAQRAGAREDRLHLPRPAMHPSAVPRLSLIRTMTMSLLPGPAAIHHRYRTLGCALVVMTMSRDVIVTHG